MMALIIRNLSKSYHGVTVFQNVNLELEDGGVYCLMAPSGAGKTTLLRILMGLEQADAGTVSGISRGQVGAVFQEDRLCQELGAIKNVRLIRPACSETQIRRELSELLPYDSLEKPVSQYSGGMRRRVALVRAMVSAGPVLLMDEPFNGLDPETKEAAIRYVQSRRNGRTLLFSTHQAGEAEALMARRLLWQEEEKTWTDFG